MRMWLEHACSADVPHALQTCKRVCMSPPLRGESVSKGCALCCLNEARQPASWCLAGSLFSVHACLQHFSFLPFQTNPSQQCPDTHLPNGMRATVSAWGLRIVCFLAQHEAASTCCQSLHISPCLLSQRNVQSG